MTEHIEIGGEVSVTVTANGDLIEVIASLAGYFAEARVTTFLAVGEARQWAERCRAKTEGSLPSSTYSYVDLRGGAFYWCSKGGMLIFDVTDAELRELANALERTADVVTTEGKEEKYEQRAQQQIRPTGADMH
jgi:hypothetical protein